MSYEAKPVKPGLNLPATRKKTSLALAGHMMSGATISQALYAQTKNPFKDHVLLVDLSGSMDHKVGDRTKIAIVHETLELIQFNYGLWDLIGFSTGFNRYSSHRELPVPTGSTNLHLPLEALNGKNIKRTLVISDGMPDNAGLTLQAASHLSGIIDVLYIGDENDAVGKAFMEKLALANHGRMIHVNLKLSRNALAMGMKLLLGQ